MATAHGKNTIITIAASDISPFTRNSSIERGAAVHEVSGYGVDDEINAPGKRNFKFTMSGVYDNTVTVGPSIVLDPKVGTMVAVVRKVEGTGTGKPQQSFNAVLDKFVETNPHDDMVTWSADFTGSGPITKISQP